MTGSAVTVGAAYWLRPCGLISNWPLLGEQGNSEVPSASGISWLKVIVLKGLRPVKPCRLWHSCAVVGYLFLEEFPEQMKQNMFYLGHCARPRWTISGNWKVGRYVLKQGEEGRDQQGRLLRYWYSSKIANQCYAPKNDISAEPINRMVSKR